MTTINTSIFKISKVKEVMITSIEKGRRKIKRKNLKLKDLCFNIKPISLESSRMLLMAKLCQLIRYFLIKVPLKTEIPNLMIVLSDLKTKLDYEFEWNFRK